MIEPGDYVSKRTGRTVTVTGIRTLVQYTTYRSGGKCVERDAESFERDYERDPRQPLRKCGDCPLYYYGEYELYWRCRRDESVVGDTFEEGEMHECHWGLNAEGPILASEPTKRGVASQEAGSE